MKKYSSTLLLLLILVILAGAYFFFKRGQSSIEGEDAHFAVKDTATVSSIKLITYLNSKEVNRAEIQRKGKKWQVGKYDASKEKVDILLRTIASLQVREPVHPNAKTNVIKMLSANHIRVEIRNSNGDEKVYFVGEEPPIGSGSMMMVNGATDPYIVELPGHNGYLKPFFSSSVDHWRQNILFSVPPMELKQLKVEYAGKDSSFEIIKKEHGFIISTGEKLDSIKLAKYLGNFGTKSAQAFLDKEMPKGRDSLSKIKPDVKLTITNINGNTNTIVFYDRDDDVNSFFGWVEGRNELLLIPRYGIESLFIKKSDLVSDK